jgi:uncharacterized protein (DUF697 family)
MDNNNNNTNNTTPKKTTMLKEVRNLVQATTDFGNALNNIIGEGINWSLDKIEKSVEKKKIKKEKQQAKLEQNQAKFQQKEQIPKKSTKHKEDELTKRELKKLTKSN